MGGRTLQGNFFFFLDRIECTACASLYYSIVACSACSCSLARLGRHVRRAPEVEAGVSFGTQKSVHRATMVRGQKTRPRIRWFDKPKREDDTKVQVFLDDPSQSRHLGNSATLVPPDRIPCPSGATLEPCTSFDVHRGSCGLCEGRIWSNLLVGHASSL